MKNNIKTRFIKQQYRRIKHLQPQPVTCPATINNNNNSIPVNSNNNKLNSLLFVETSSLPKFSPINKDAVAEDQNLLDFNHHTSASLKNYDSNASILTIIPAVTDTYTNLVDNTNWSNNNSNFSNQ